MMQELCRLKHLVEGALNDLIRLVRYLCVSDTRYRDECEAEDSSHPQVPAVEQLVSAS